MVARAEVLVQRLLMSRLPPSAVAVLFVAFTLNSNLQGALITIDTVRVGNPGNAADATGYGAVAYEFKIGKYEVTIGQYTSFLNAVAATDTYSLYNPNMATDLNIAGITQTGTSGSFAYSVIGSGNRPISYVSWFDAARFANWMQNGATTGASTETGAYTLNGASSGVGFTKNAGATWWIPSEDEWYKAAYFDPTRGSSGGYWDYPTRSDTAPGNTIGGTTNQANFNNGVRSVTQSADYDSSQNYLTDAGVFSNSESAYDTFDQGGNVWEWNDAVLGLERGRRGGSWNFDASYLESGGRSSSVPTSDLSRLGFRVASADATPIPEPGTWVAMAIFAGGAAYAGWRRRRQVTI
jgi:sulfatase modifying factor 1